MADAPLLLLPLLLAVVVMVLSPLSDVTACNFPDFLASHGLGEDGTARRRDWRTHWRQRPSSQFSLVTLARLSTSSSLLIVSVDMPHPVSGINFRSLSDNLCLSVARLFLADALAPAHRRRRVVLDVGGGVLRRRGRHG